MLPCSYPSIQSRSAGTWLYQLASRRSVFQSTPFFLASESPSVQTPSLSVPGIPAVFYMFSISTNPAMTTLTGRCVTSARSSCCMSQCYSFSIALLVSYYRPRSIVSMQWIRSVNHYFLLYDVRHL